VEVSDVFVHADSLLRLTSLHELSFCLLVSFLILEFECEFQMHISDLVFGV
jgi:hypothetical protein